MQVLQVHLRAALAAMQSILRNPTKQCLSLLHSRSIPITKVTQVFGHMGDRSWNLEAFPKCLGKKPSPPLARSRSRDFPEEEFSSSLREVPPRLGCPPKVGRFTILRPLGHASVCKGKGITCEAKYTKRHGLIDCKISASIGRRRLVCRNSR